MDRNNRLLEQEGIANFDIKLEKDILVTMGISETYQEIR